MGKKIIPTETTKYILEIESDSDNTDPVWISGNIILIACNFQYEE